MAAKAQPDLSIFEALGRREQRDACKVGAALEKLQPKERPAVDAAIRSDNENVRRGVRKWLSERDIRLSTSAVGSHRHGTCTCARS